MHALQAKILDPRLGTEFPLPAYATPGSAGLTNVRDFVPANQVPEPSSLALLGMALVAGRNRVPRPATGKTALRIGLRLEVSVIVSLLTNGLLQYCDELHDYFEQMSMC